MLHSRKIWTSKFLTSNLKKLKPLNWMKSLPYYIQTLKGWSCEKYSSVNILLRVVNWGDTVQGWQIFHMTLYHKTMWGIVFRWRVKFLVIPAHLWLLLTLHSLNRLWPRSVCSFICMSWKRSWYEIWVTIQPSETQIVMNAVIRKL